jgi:hypothetical protein
MRKALRADFQTIRLGRCSLQSLCLAICLTLGTSALQANGQQLSGFYGVAEIRDLGPEMRVTLHIKLVNQGEERFFITKIGLVPQLPTGRSEVVPASVILTSHGSQDITQQFTIPTQEYERWTSGAWPRVALEIEVADGSETRFTIALVRLPGTWVN